MSKKLIIIAFILIVIFSFGYSEGITTKYFNVAGIEGAVISRPDLTTVNTTLMFKGGKVLDPEGKDGVAELFAMMIDKGTENKKAMEIATILDTLGSNFTGSAGDEAVYFNIWSLKDNLDKTFEISGEILNQPTFPMEEYQKQAKRFITSLFQVTDNPGTVADIIFNKHIYENHPYGQSATPATVNQISPEDLKAFYNNYINKENLFIVFAGNIDLNTAKRLTKEHFATLKATGKELKTVPPVPEHKGIEIYAYNKSDANQTQIRYGFTGVKRNITDYNALSIMNYILGGGGFSSRLMLKVRTAEGLTYGISSRYAAKAKGGAFRINTFTKNKTVGKAINLIEEEIEKMIKKGVKKEELKNAKSFYVGNFPLSLETPRDYAYRILDAQLYGLGKDYIETRLKKIKAVTLEDANKAAKKYLDSKNKVIVAVGKLKEIKEQLSKFGEVKVIKSIY